jgi:hypothetical protein
MGFQHLLQMVTLQEWRIAAQDQYRTGKIGQFRFGAKHGVAGAELLVLFNAGDREGADRLFHPVSLVADDDDGLDGPQRLYGIEHVVKHRSEKDFVQYLGTGRLHSRTFAGG